MYRARSRDAAFPERRGRAAGLEAAIYYDDDKWKLFAGYSFINATFRDAITLSSPNNPFADADGLIHVQPGDHTCHRQSTQHRFKAAAGTASLSGGKWAPISSPSAWAISRRRPVNQNPGVAPLLGA